MTQLTKKELEIVLDCVETNYFDMLVQFPEAYEEVKDLHIAIRDKLKQMIKEAEVK